MKWSRKRTYIVLCLFSAVVLMISVAAVADYLNDQKAQRATIAAQAAETARIAADPLSITNIITHVNEERSMAGDTALTEVVELDESSKAKCDDMVAGDYYDHVNPVTGMHGYDYIKQYVKSPYAQSSEDLNEGNVKTSDEFVKSWISSPAHKESLLNSTYNYVGVALCNIPSEGAGYTAVVMHLIYVPEAAQKPTTIIPIQSSSTYTQPLSTNPKSTPNQLTYTVNTCNEDKKASVMANYNKLVQGENDRHALVIEQLTNTANTAPQPQAGIAIAQMNIENQRTNSVLLSYKSSLTAALATIYCY